MRNQIDIERVSLRNPAKKAGITYSQSFEEWEAAHGARLDFWAWDNNVYSNQFKAKVLEWWKLHNLVDAHSQDANIKRR